MPIFEGYGAFKIGFGCKIHQGYGGDRYLARSLVFHNIVTT